MVSQRETLSTEDLVNHLAETHELSKAESRRILQTLVDNMTEVCVCLCDSEPNKTNIFVRTRSLTHNNNDYGCFLFFLFWGVFLLWEWIGFG